MLRQGAQGVNAEPAAKPQNDNVGGKVTVLLDSEMDRECAMKAAYTA